MRDVPILVDGGRAELEVTEPGPRGLSLEADAQSRLRLALEGAPIAWGRVARALAGITWVRAEGSRSLAIVPPLRAKDARAHATPEDWTRTFARALVASPRSPLRPGRWEIAVLTQRAPTAAEKLRGVTPDEHHEADQLVARGLSRALDAPRESFSPWRVVGDRHVTPLRDPSPEDAARVKSFRKLAREGVLPPVLLWWISAIDGCVVLDGHDRLLAAKLEGARPRAVVVWAVQEEPPEPAWSSMASERYERAFASEAALSPRARREQNEQLVGAFGGYRYHFTPSVARSDLAQRFDAELGHVRDTSIRARLID